jgi:polysaccharide deacetylase 2 family uncharacterized protein YibQ
MKGNRSSTRIRNSLLILILIGFALSLILILLPRGEEKPDIVESVESAGQTDEQVREVPEEIPSESKPTAVYLAVVIDDAGYSLSNLEPFLRYPGPLTIAILPHLTYSVESAENARKAGKDVILHCPMEPLGDEDPGPGAILVEHDKEKIQSLLEAAFQSVPEAVGMNNHMGSRVMQDSRVMETIMSDLKSRKKFFLDSRTVPNSMAEFYASRYGVSFLERNIFLDNDNQLNAIRKQFLEGVELAKNQGYAILIGHVSNRAILTIVEELSPWLEQQGVEMTTLAELL